MVEQSNRENASDLRSFALKKPPTLALRRQNRRYHEAATLLMIQSAANRDKRWEEVVRVYLMILADNPGTSPEVEAELKAALSRLQLILSEKAMTVEWIQAWGHNWLADAGHTDENPETTEGLVVVKWEMQLGVLSQITRATKLVVTQRSQLAG